MNHTTLLQVNPPFSMSELDPLSDSDWLDVASNRESDNESVVSADLGESDREELVRALSRRSSISVGSSREGDIEAWEGFASDSGDEDIPKDELQDNMSATLTADLGEIGEGADAQGRPNSVEEERVKEGLDQSLCSTLSASRSSNTASAHSSIRDLRLSFPDPLTSSRDELTRSYDDVDAYDTTFTSTDVPTDVPTDCIPDAGELTDDAVTDYQTSGSWAVRHAPTVVKPVSVPELKAVPRERAEFDVVLYGSSSAIKWSFAQDLVQKVVTISGRTVIGSTVDDNKHVMYIQLERQPVHTVNAFEFVAVYDRTTDNVRTYDVPIMQDFKRPSLAILYLPSLVHTLPEHTLYLPVLLPSVSSPFAVEHEWHTLGIPRNKVARLTKDVDSQIFDSTSIEEIPQLRAHRLLERLVYEGKKRPFRTISEHLKPSHAVTLLALVSLVMGVAMNTGFRKPYTPTPTVPASPSPSLWEILGPEINQTTIFPAAATAQVQSSVVATTHKEVSLSLYNSGTTPLTVMTRRDVGISATMATPGHSPERTGEKPNKKETTSDVIVRQTSQLSAVNLQPSRSDHFPHWIAGPSRTKTSGTKTNTGFSSMVDTLSEVLDLHVKSIRRDLDELVTSLDELSRAIQRQTKAITNQKAKELRNTVQYRHGRAKGNAKELKKRGQRVLSSAHSQIIERTDQARKRAQEIGKGIVTSDGWNVYQVAQAEWASMLKKKGVGWESGSGEKIHGQRLCRCGGKCRKVRGKAKEDVFFSCANFLA